MFRPSVLREELRFLSARKLYNRAMERAAPRLGLVRLPYRPSKISVESGNVCELRCPLCPTGQRDGSASKGMLSLETFARVLDALAPDLLTIRLYNWGEPLLNPDLVRLCDLAYTRRVSVKLSTHLNDLSPEIAAGLLRARVKKIYISADGASAETYARYRRGGDWKRVLDNVRLLVRTRAELGAHFTRVVWLFHVFRHNEHEIPAARRLARELGVTLKIAPARTDMGREIFETAAEALARDGHWLPVADEHCAFDREAKTAQREAACTLPWRDAAIHWDGKVLACCNIYSEKHHYGSLEEQDFGAIWNGPLYTEARREILGRGPTRDTICKICKKNGYLFL